MDDFAASDVSDTPDSFMDVDDLLSALSSPITSARSDYDLIVIDANGVMHGCFQAVERGGDETSASLPSAVSRLVLRKLDGLVEAYPHARVVLAWDGRDNRAVRRALYPAYKAGRGAKPPELTEAMRQVYIGARSRQWEQPVSSDYEADDVIASFVRQFHLDRKRPAQPNVRVPQLCLVVSEDGDLQQLVDGAVHQYHPLRMDYVTPVSLSMAGKRRGASHGHTKSLMGDSGDNIPGVPGIGPEKAAATLEAVPDFVTRCIRGERPDWERLDGVLYAAYVRAGRKLTHPVLAKKDKRMSSEDRALRSVEGVVREAWKMVALEDGLFD